MDPTWPSALRQQRLVEYSQTDRPYGYDFKHSVAIEFENDVETIWTTNGKVYDRNWGTEQILEMQVENMPPHMKLEEVPKRIERKFIRGRRRRNGFEATVEHKITFADGSMQAEKETAVFDEDVQEMAKLPEREVVEGLNAVYEHGEPISRISKPGKRYLEESDGK